jgi:diaminopimelate decarboxylase
MFCVRNGVLHVAGVSIATLAHKYPGPFYVYDGDAIELQITRIRTALSAGVQVFYSMKANPNASVVALLSTLADGVDVSSWGELQVALHAGFAPSQVLFVGPSKSHEEIEGAIRAGIGCLVIESKAELFLADRIAARLGEIVNVALRVNPAFEAGGSRLKMGGASTQFGIDEEQLGDVIVSTRKLTNVRVIGLHAYVGTRILDWSVALRNTTAILELALRMQEQFKLELRLVDVGGGLGVPYFQGEQPFDFDRFIAEVNPIFREFQTAVPGVRLVMELGRFIVAEAGVYVSEVRYLKTSRGKQYALVSGGTNHFQATASVDSILKRSFPIKLLNKMENGAVSPIVVCGPLCTPADVLGRGVDLPAVEVGDLIGVLNAGAYGMTASPLEFLSHAWPSEVLVYQGTAYLVRKPPSISDVLRFQPLIRVKKVVEDVSMAV